ncbi:MAG: hypothetical protein WBH40_02355 [Ignavibacteriaceae bacterium]
MDSSSDNSALNEILNYLKNIDDRVSKIEERINIQSSTVESTEAAKKESQVEIKKSDEGLEERIGQVWFPKIGIVVLIVGFAFFLTLPLNELPVILPALMGYFLAAVLFGLAKFWKQTFLQLSGYLISGGFVLLYLTTMRLYYFSGEKAIDSFPVIIILLLAVTAITLITAVRRNSINFTRLGITFGFATAVLSDYSYIIFSLISVLSICVVLFHLKYKWNSLLFYGMFLAYFTHLIWFMNNPLLGHSLQSVSEPESNLFFILAYVVIFSFAYLFSRKDEQDDYVSASVAMFNSSGGFGLFILITLLTTPSAFSFHQLIASFVFITIAVIYWIKINNKYSTFFYAMFGYVALSVAIIGQFEKPDYFIWLCWQSLFVVSTAIWFRSKFIIVANFIIYLMMFFGYLIVAESAGGISLSFGIVALISARILNWKKDQLELKTEQMRNAYLLSALFIIPYALFQMFPAGYVSLSWIAIAIIYFILSIILKNVKYRWMALATYFLTVVYVFIFGITSAETLLKIMSFVVLGVSLIVVSLVYTRKKGREKEETSNTNQSED